VGGSDKSQLMGCVCGRLYGKQRQMSCFSQGNAATLFRLGWQVYNFLVWNFLGILFTKNYFKNSSFFAELFEI